MAIYVQGHSFERDFFEIGGIRSEITSKIAPPDRPIAEFHGLQAFDVVMTRNVPSIISGQHVIEVRPEIVIVQARMYICLVICKSERQVFNDFRPDNTMIDDGSLSMKTNHNCVI